MNALKQVVGLIGLDDEEKRFSQSSSPAVITSYPAAHIYIKSLILKTPNFRFFSPSQWDILFHGQERCSKMLQQRRSWTKHDLSIRHRSSQQPYTHHWEPCHPAKHPVEVTYIQTDEREDESLSFVSCQPTRSTKGCFLVKCPSIVHIRSYIPLTWCCKGGSLPHVLTNNLSESRIKQIKVKKKCIYQYSTLDFLLKKSVVIASVY